MQFGACNSTSGAIARDRASEIAGAVIKVLGRRANSFPVTNYGVLRSRAEILRVIGRRGRRGRGIVLHAESACNGGNGERERSCSSRIPLLNGIKGTGLNLIGIGSRKKGDYYYRGRRGMVIGSADEGEILSKWRRFRAFQ